MFNQVDDKCLQFIKQEQHQFRKGDQEENKILGDKVELCLSNIYLSASHILSYKWSYKKTVN